MKRSAFTLIELLIVLSLIVVIAGLMVPSISNMNMRSQLSTAAKELRTELHKAKLIAMKSGETQVFQYQPATGNYEILPKTEYDKLHPRARNSETIGLQAKDVSGADGSTPDTSPPTFGGSMKKPATFGDMFPDGPSTFGSDSAKLAAQKSVDPSQIIRETLPKSVTFVSFLQLQSTQSWSEPIYFFPNGRTSTVELALMISGEKSYSVDISLRGLTGTARLGQLQPLR